MDSVVDYINNMSENGQNEKSMIQIRFSKWAQKQHLYTNILMLLKLCLTTIMLLFLQIRPLATSFLSENDNIVIA